MLARTFSSVISGIIAVPVEVQTKILPVKNDRDFKFEIIGLADTAIREARHRVSSALKVFGIAVPKHILVNLSPAGIKKDGSGFDLAIAVTILKATKKLSLPVKNCGYYGELGLDGSIKEIPGIVAHAISAKQNGWTKLFVSRANAEEINAIQGLEIIPLDSIADLFAYVQGSLTILPSINVKIPPESKDQNCLLDDIYGQEQAKRALVIAATGGHNLLLVGPPGCGKSMLAERLIRLLNSMSIEEAIETAAIHSIAGISTKELLAGKRPFRNPHYTISDIGLIGGGNIPKPGEISLAHNGVLFLDEFPEYRRQALEALRAPLESKKLLISRAKYQQEFPANFQLVAAMNPCPCGMLGTVKGQCLCSAQAISKYLQKLSGPILDRIDLQVSLQAVEIRQINHQSKQVEITSGNLLKKIEFARAQAAQRQGVLNSQLENKKVIRLVKLSANAESFLENFSKKRNLSARAYFRVLKVALTIADLRSSDSVEIEDIAEALSFRSLDLIREYVGT